MPLLPLLDLMTANTGLNPAQVLLMYQPAQFVAKKKIQYNIPENYTTWYNSIPVTPPSFDPTLYPRQTEQFVTKKRQSTAQPESFAIWHKLPSLLDNMIIQAMYNQPMQLIKKAKAILLQEPEYYRQPEPAPVEQVSGGAGRPRRQRQIVKERHKSTLTVNLLLKLWLTESLKSSFAANIGLKLLYPAQIINTIQARLHTKSLLTENLGFVIKARKKLAIVPELKIKQHYIVRNSLAPILKNKHRFIAWIRTEQIKIAELEATLLALFQHSNIPKEGPDE